MFKLFLSNASKEKYFKNEVNCANFIPYKCHWNKNTILTNKNELMQVVKVSGYSFETADDEDLDIRKNLRNLLFKSMASGSLTLYFHTFRSKQPLITNKKDVNIIQ